METEAVKRELDDSGCVQDDSSPPLKKLCVYPNGYTRQVGLLDLSDDVLLIILRQCSPMELKALAFTCPRLARLSLERALWQRVDARAVPYDRRRLRWLLAYAVDKRTTELLLTGHAEQAAGCEDFNKNAREKNAPRCGEEEESNTNGSTSGSDPDWNGGDVRRNPTAQGPAFIIRDMGSGISVGAHSCSHIASFRHNLQRPNISHAYSEDSEEQLENSCPSPVFTLCESILNRIKSACNLTNLALEYCNINCKMTGLNLFPTTLKHLSLKGSRCYNLPLDKTYLFKIQDYLPALEFLDVSHCDWLEPASLLPLSKLPALSRVFMRNCRRLTEFVAYASLAARYGFKALKEIDFQGSPVGDSEVSAFGWVQTLEVIRLSAPKQPKTRAHEHKELIADWEKEEPEYLTRFQADYQVEAPEDPNEDINIQKQSASLDEPCGLGIVVCLNDIRRQQEQDRRQREDRRRHAGQEQRSNNNRENEDGNRNENDNAEDNASPAPKRRKVNGSSQTDEEIVENQPSCSREADSNDNQNQPTATFRRISPPVMSSSEKNDDDKKQNEDEKNTAELKSSINEGAGTSNSEPSSSNCEPSSSNCEPSTSNCEPSTSNCEPSTSNNGPSTSKSPQDPPNPTGQNPDAEYNRQRFQQFVRFRQNERPVIIRRHVLENDQNENNNDPNQNENANQNQALPRHSVLYVSVAQQVPNFDFRNLYSCRDYNCIGYDFRTNNPISSTLITDSSVSRFGRSDGENVNYVHLGENQLILRYRRDTGARPDRSNLREIVANNYRFITDRSLTHLATAAPNLRFVDFRGTRVTNTGVENFLSIRPDCEVLFDPFQEDNLDGGDGNE